MTRIRFEDLPSRNTPRNAENLNKLNNVVISPTEPTTGEEVWIKKGKNLLKVKPQTTTLNGVTMTVNSDGSIILNGTATANTSMAFSDLVFYGVGDYAFGITTDFSSIGYSFEVGGYVHNVDGSYKYNLSSAHPTRTFLEGEYVEGFTIFFLSGATFNNLILYPQLEQGTTPTSFEPYVDKEIYVKNDNGVYEEFINVEKLKGNVLFDGYTNEDVTLTDSTANYDYIEVFFADSDSVHNSVKIYKPDGKKISLSCNDSYATGSNIKSKLMDISGNTISNRGTAYNETKIASNGTITFSNTNLVYVTRVVGYKD